MNRAAAAISPESAAEAPISGEKSIGSAAQCASAPATAVIAKNARNRPEPKRRATGGPKAISQIELTTTCVHEPCSRA